MLTVLFIQSFSNILINIFEKILRYETVSVHTVIFSLVSILVTDENFICFLSEQIDSDVIRCNSIFIINWVIDFEIVDDV